MINLHQYAVSLEHTLRGILECDRGGLGGLIDADAIEYGSMFTVIVSTLSIKYIGEKNTELIDRFIESILEYEGKRMAEIGEQKIKGIIDSYREVYSQLE
ncbi:hypothetical protein [Clostridium tagluense]|uniref:hypothetical protein n=1 Tax=Clostridium tagluense TaxID=360422 RepID=UPI001CF44563|nr:hypothetical protein [Clostridium tagluense]MCB2299900.1 hypothetical protein [Clostridium tagluense]